MCSIRIRNLRCALIRNERRKSEKKKFGREKPAKKSKISPEGTDVAALRKSLLKKRRHLEKKLLRGFAQIRLSKKRRNEMN